MSSLIRAFNYFVLLLVLRHILGDSGLPAQPLLQLDNIITQRINSMLRQHEQLNTRLQSVGFLEQYRRLAEAAKLPIGQLDEKIMAYNGYRAYGGQISEPMEHKLIELPRLFDRENRQYNVSDIDTTQPNKYSPFENRVISLLQKLGVHDEFSNNVFKAILNDEAQLRKLKMKLDELDKMDKMDKNGGTKKPECCLWDLIFDLFDD